jgi:membrane protein YqaA with SNARE-associated domain
MLRRLYDWCIAAAGKPHASWTMGTVSFAESSFFPVPPDVMLIPLSLARPDRAWSYATLCTWTSVAGGVLGYLIGAVLYDSVGQWLIQLYGYGDKVEAFRDAYARYGAWIILLKGLTPIPYKIVTITSGFAGYNLPLFIALSFVASRNSDMGARRDLRHHAAEFGVVRDLAGHDARQDARAPVIGDCHHGRRGLVATRLDAENGLHAASSSAIAGWPILPLRPIAYR